MINYNSQKISIIYYNNKKIAQAYYNNYKVYQAEYEAYVSGILPLHLTNSVGADLVDWSITGDTVQNSGTYNSDSKSVTVRGVEATTNYAYFNIADFDTIAIGDSVSFVVGGTTYSLKVMKIDSNYVYVENKEV